jgi:hypothetical protein
MIIIIRYDNIMIKIYIMIIYVLGASFLHGFSILHIGGFNPGPHFLVLYPSAEHGQHF